MKQRLPQMKVLQQAQPSSDHVSPDMRWAGFWLFWAFYTLSGLDVVVGLRRSSEELVLSVTAFASLTVVAGCPSSRRLGALGAPASGSWSGWSDCPPD